MIIPQNKLKSILDDRGITPYRIAKDNNFNLSFFYQMINGNMKMFPKYRKAISKYLDLAESEWFEE